MLRTDARLKSIIEKTAAYAVQYGPTFESILMQRTRDDKNYSFLSNGAYSDYYRWILQCYRKGGVPRQASQMVCIPFAPLWDYSLLTRLSH